ncbi:MAG: 16S rRNA (cytosine(1402)-N(4))-methyltransferase RsmH, partial [Bacteroidetes bacterium]|nr:16S rRNA (cytosine(1402)-N(4))-methyltransferase RsmH [Bacteroidota bacterium]
KQTAAGILNDYPVQELARMFREYGEITNARKLAEAVSAFREKRTIRTTGHFRQTAEECIPRNREHKYLAKAFQALRIEVNGEIENLKVMLLQVPDVLKKGGRLAVVTYHSLEDRVVKNFIRSGNFEGRIETDLYGNRDASLLPVNRKVIVPATEELNRNNRARSAKLRIAEKT